MTRLPAWARHAAHRHRQARRSAARIQANARETRDLRAYVDMLRGVLETRLARTRAELEHALVFITARGLRDDWETASAARRRAEGERRQR
jgi:hypothetical protein